MVEEEVSDECVAFLRAVSEMIPEKCGSKPGYLVEIEGAGELRIPMREVEEAEKILEEKRELTKEEQFRALKETWGAKIAAGWCSKVAGLVVGSEAYNTCVENVSEKMARGMLR